MLSSAVTGETIHNLLHGPVSEAHKLEELTKAMQLAEEERVGGRSNDGLRDCLTHYTSQGTAFANHLHLTPRRGTDGRISAWIARIERVEALNIRTPALLRPPVSSPPSHQLEDGHRLPAPPRLRRGSGPSNAEQPVPVPEAGPFKTTPAEGGASYDGAVMTVFEESLDDAHNLCLPNPQFA
jgi:hypothetical protein